MYSNQNLFKFPIALSTLLIYRLLNAIYIVQFIQKEYKFKKMLDKHYTVCYNVKRTRAFYPYKDRSALFWYIIDFYYIKI